jgi:hypothetical protein
LGFGRFTADFGNASGHLGLSVIYFSATAKAAISC